jgi:predicted nuclease of predicted toxin-antitoxin system
MPVALYVDVHVPLAISEQLRRSGVDVLTALEDSFEHNLDHEVLERARHLGRVAFTQDIRFKALAEDWQPEPDITSAAARGGPSLFCP